MTLPVTVVVAAGTFAEVTTPGTAVFINLNVELASLLAEANATSTTSAVLQRVRRLTGSAAGASGPLSTVVVIRLQALDGTSAGSATTSIVLTRLQALTGASDGSATATATLARVRTRTLASAGTSTTSGSLDIAGGPSYKYMTATAAGSATVTAITAQRHAFTVASAGSATTSVSLQRLHALSAASAGTATVLVMLNRGRRVIGTSAGVATALGHLEELGPRVYVTGTSAGHSTSAGVLTTRSAYPPNAVIWLGDHFGMSKTGDHVRWSGDEMSLTEGEVVVWADDIFKEALPP